MKLNDWIDSKGPGRVGCAAVASLLGEKPRTVLSWYRQERAPCFRAAFNIVRASSGEVDYNGIFVPMETGQIPGVNHAVG